MLVDVALPGALLGAGGGHGDVLIEARQRAVESAGEPERTKGEQAFGVIQVPDDFADGPFVRRVPMARLLVANRAQQRQRLCCLGVEQVSDVAVAHLVDVGEVVPGLPRFDRVAGSCLRAYRDWMDEAAGPIAKSWYATCSDVSTRKRKETIVPEAGRSIRYAVVGLGHIAQVAVLPAFAHALRNSQLVAVVSGDRTKRREIAKRYRLEHAFSYDQFDDCLRVVDAVYIALPNSMHAEYTIRAARAGVHVLCEKPLAVTVEECRQMIAACRKGNVKLMVAYRLHFEAINLSAMDLARSGKLGDLKYFNSSFSLTVRRGDIRTKRAYRRRDPVRHRRLLHQRRTLPVSIGAYPGLGVLGQQRSLVPLRDRRNHGRDAPIRERSSGDFCDQLQRC